MTTYNPAFVSQNRRYIRVKFEIGTFTQSGLTFAQLLAGSYTVTPLAPVTAPMRLLLPSFNSAKSIRIERTLTAFAIVANTFGNPANVPLKLNATSAATGAGTPVEYDGNPIQDKWVSENPLPVYFSSNQLSTIDYTSFLLTCSMDIQNFATTTVFNAAAAGHIVVFTISTGIIVDFHA